MKQILVALAVVFTFVACDKNETELKNRLQLSLDSCVLDNEHSYIEVKKLSGAGSLQVMSSDPDIADISYDEKNKNVFYIIGHRTGYTSITVIDADDNTTGADYAVKTIYVNVRESISYEEYSYQTVFMKKGDFRIFNLPFKFDKNDSIVGANDYIASVSANVALGNQLKVKALANGKTKFKICKGKIDIFTIYINVVNEYDLFIPESENSQLTFDLPFIVGVNGISVWRGSGQYTARVVDETIAVVESITLQNDHFNQQTNSAVVRVTPLKRGSTKLLVTDVITKQTASVNVVVH